VKVLDGGEKESFEEHRPKKEKGKDSRKKGKGGIKEKKWPPLTVGEKEGGGGLPPPLSLPPVPHDTGFHGKVGKGRGGSEMVLRH